MKHIEQYVNNEVQKLASVAADNARSNLLALSPAILPQLIAEYRAAINPRIRAGLITVVCEFRDVSTCDFLLEAMDDVHEQIWMSALDGLVTIGGMQVVRRLYELSATLNFDDPRGPWMLEAAEQIAQATK